MARCDPAESRPRSRASTPTSRGSGPRILFQEGWDGPRARWLRFGRPLQVVSTRRVEEVGAAWERVAEGVRRGAWAAGFLAYEAAPAFDAAMVTHPPSDHGPPLFWWGLFDRPENAEDPFVGSGPGAVAPPDLPPLEWRSGWSEEEHRRAVERIREHIAAGDTYQVNLTFPWYAPFGGDARQLFTALWSCQRPSHGVFLDGGEWAICSVSPELFFAQDDGRLVARPMKGTSSRGRFPAEDGARRAELRGEKNRAENLMIVDMMRNDLGRVAIPGSVRVRRLFAEETYPTVHQLVSEVEARTSSSPFEVLAALFPCASITGAPKLRTMELIRGLEAGPRGVYTGTLGFVEPGGRARFSVAIRTAVVDRARRIATYFTGGGIVWDSRASAELQECRTKALVLADAASKWHGFELLETLLHRPKSGFFLLERHLERMAASAGYFGFPWDAEAAVRALEQSLAPHGRAPLGGSLECADPSRLRHKVRLLLDRAGRFRAEAHPWPCEGRSTWTVMLDARPVNERDPFLFHKTTRRQRYEEAVERFPEADEVLLWNRRGELTEGARTNLALRFGSRWLTPPVACGLLAGTYRAELLARGRLEEEVLPLAALHEADAVYLLSSVRGIVRARLESPYPRPGSPAAEAAVVTEIGSAPPGPRAESAPSTEIR